MSIVGLARQSAKDNTDISGDEVTSGESWIMTLSAPSSTVTAYNEIEAGGVSFGFPVRGASHSDLESLKMVDYSVEHKDDQQDMFTVTANYSNSREERDTNTSTDPLDAPISYKYDQLDLAVPVLSDKDTGALILNLLGKPPLSPFVENEPLTRITIVKNEYSYDNDKAEDIRNTVNKQKQKINGRVYTAGTVKLERFTGNNQFDQDNNEYYVVTYQVLIKKDGFKRTLMERSRTNKFGQAPVQLVRHDDGAAYLDEDGTYRELTADPKGLSSEWATIESKSWSINL